MNRRTFLGGSVLASVGGALAADAARQTASGQPKPPPADKPAPKDAMPTGKIGNLTVSRILLGGNLLTHFTHSRDLKYVYNLTAHYNTPEKITETLALAESHGIDTMSVHNPPGVVEILQKYRKSGGKMKWIICPTAPIDKGMVEHSKQVQQLVDAGSDAIYIWGVRSDPLAAAGKADLLAEAVKVAKDHGVPCGVGCHDLRVVVLCEKHKVPADFYIKTFHHHRYPTGPKPEEIKGPHSEYPGYWCSNPKETIEVMQKVEKPWIAFKVMAAGAIPPGDAFPYVFDNGGDHVLAGMFDFEIAEDVKIAKQAVANAKRVRPWKS